MGLWVLWMLGPQEVAASIWRSLGGSPGGGGRYPDIPAAGVLGVVMPPEEVVALHPGDSPTTWLHDRG